MDSCTPGLVSQWRLKPEGELLQHDGVSNSIGVTNPLFPYVGVEESGKSLSEPWMEEVSPPWASWLVPGHCQLGVGSQPFLYLPTVFRFGIPCVPHPKLSLSRFCAIWNALQPSVPAGLFPFQEPWVK